MSGIAAVMKDAGADPLWQLLPCDTRPGDHQPGARTRQYGLERSGRILYRFNAAGYRGEDYDPEAAFRFCVIGESESFGIGIDEHLAWPRRLADHLAAALRLAPEDVNVVNLSVGDASADYITRTLIRQVPGLVFDLVICHFPPPHRMEFFDGSRFRQFTRAGIAHRPPDWLSGPERGFRALQNDHMARLGYLRNLLLAQALLEGARQPYLLATEHLEADAEPNPALRPLLAALDPRWILCHRLFQARHDLAVDGRHAGPATHGALAVAMLDLIADQLDRRGREDEVEAIRAYAEAARDADADWLAVAAGAD